ncbi:hypothetical protein FB567DRAFT_606487 [Paraphoma chrysanthemicola]|uniref:trans-L-3-hydroxyproline dehydratase n=1 Tax=Paraphoma chrysanthemicola TaxID=798071 RepID=A0A8K0R0Q9_9PLEO|nr:hypothetical protein FB567DRAFT_606487 [Paraphoma chrysanthemicola]
MTSGLQPAPYWVETEDWHTAGEPFRIVEHLPAGHLPEGTSVAERRLHVLRDPSHPLDTLRRTLCHEPRGHADMYGGFIVPANDLWYTVRSCGHGTMALGYWAVSSGLVKVPTNDCAIDVIIDVPSGRVKASVTIENGRPVHVDFVNVASRTLTNTFDLSIPSQSSSVQFDPSSVSKFIDLARLIKQQLLIDKHVGGQADGETKKDSEGITIHERNVVVYGDGQIDRSPCGSGTSARVAIHHAEGKLLPSHGVFLNQSIIKTSFEARVLASDDSSTCIPAVRGRAGLVGRMKFYIDPEDPIYPGFLLQ